VVSAARWPPYEPAPGWLSQTVQGSGRAPNGDPVTARLSVDPVGGGTLQVEVGALGLYSTLYVEPDGGLATPGTPALLGWVRQGSGGLVLTYFFQHPSYASLLEVPLQVVGPPPPAAVEIRTNKGCGASFGANEAVEVWVRVAQRAMVDVTFVRSDGAAGGVLARAITVEPGGWVSVPVPSGWFYPSQWEIDVAATSGGVTSTAACGVTVTAVVPPPPE
jgi:hypothetical protein